MYSDLSFGFLVRLTQTAHQVELVNILIVFQINLSQIYQIKMMNSKQLCFHLFPNDVLLFLNLMTIKILNISVYTKC